MKALQQDSNVPGVLRLSNKNRNLKRHSINLHGFSEEEFETVEVPNEKKQTPTPLFQLLTTEKLQNTDKNSYLLNYYGKTSKTSLKFNKKRQQKPK